MVTGIIAPITDHTIGRITGIGVRHHAIVITHRAIAPHQSIVAVATRMYAGASIAIGHTGFMTIRFSPITAHAASVIRLIFKQKSPGQTGAFSRDYLIQDQVTKAPMDAATSPMATAIITP